MKRINKVDEAQLKSELVLLARKMIPRYVIIRHEDVFTHGIPDISITGNKRISWLEVKLATPKFKSKGIQELTMLRLASAGIAWYPVYYEVGDVRRVYRVHPSEIGKPIEEWKNFAEGFNHEWVIQEIINDHYR